jgi:hypothetical protein
VRHRPYARFSPIVGTLIYVASVWFLVFWEYRLDEVPKILDAAMKTPYRASWCLLVAAQMTWWASIIYPAYRRALKYSDQFHMNRSELIWNMAAFLLMCTIYISLRYRSIPADLVLHQKMKTLLITAFGAVTVMPCLVGFTLVSLAPSAVNLGEAPKPLDELRSDFKWFLIVTGCFVIFASITRGIEHLAFLKRTNRRLCQACFYTPLSCHW